jgi:type VI protein secretion system component Hcp
MSVDTFLVFPVVAGATTIPGSPQADVFFGKAFGNAAITRPLDFSLGAEAAIAVGTSMSVGKTQLLQFTVSKPVDKLSPYLFEVMVSGRHFAVVQLYQRKSDSVGGKPYLGYEFQNVFVAGINCTGGGGEEPMEQLIFAYQALVVGTREQNPDGTLTPVVKRSWNQVTASPAPPDNLLLS